MKIKEDFFGRQKQAIGVSLNEVQIKAVLQTEGPLLLLASPGSGKTTTLIMKIGYLIEEKGAEPSRIKAVTFSRASAADMKKRFKQYFPEIPPVDFSTIHSFAYEVVQAYFHKTKTSFQIIEGELDVQEQENVPPVPLLLRKKMILRELFKEITGDNITDDQLDELTTYISFIKNKMILPENWRLVKSTVPKAEQVLREYEAFKKSGHQKRLLDFDDMLSIGNDILEQNPALLRMYQQRFDYILSDESQDTSLVQHAIIEKLARGHRNLCVVADDDQSIYSWRGAEPSYLLNFQNVYPDAAFLFMEQNYRSSQNIVHTANEFIKRNKQRYKKKMFTENPPGAAININFFENAVIQAKYLAGELQGMDNLSETAVLYRNNSSSIALVNEFDRAGIPFYMKDADNRFFSHWVVEDILNFMRMSFTDKRPEILEKIHFKFNGYISKSQMNALKEFTNSESVFDNLLNYVPIQDYQVKPLKASKATFQKMRGMPPLQAILVIRDQLGYEKALEKMCERFGFKKDYLFGILNTLEEIAATLTTMEEFAGRLKHLQSRLKTAKFKKGQNAVTLSTFHSSKGLEFEQVYMVDLVEGILPSSEDRSSPERMEEAARLFYVGMTRAKKELKLCFYKSQDGKTALESSFVAAVRNIMHPMAQNAEKESSGQAPARKNINLNAIRHKGELTEGKQLTHKVFGNGTIVRVEEETLYIQFETERRALLITACLELGLLEPI